jgi:hypothetical protein
LRNESDRDSRNVVNGAVRGLRVLEFGKKNIFVLTGMIVRSRTPDVVLVANHRPAIRNTRIAAQASRTIGLQ